MASNLTLSGGEEIDRNTASYTAERSWTADEGTAPKIKAQEPVRIPDDADPDALPDFAGVVIAAPDP